MISTRMDCREGVYDRAAWARIESNVDHRHQSGTKTKRKEGVTDAGSSKLATSTCDVGNKSCT